MSSLSTVVLAVAAIVSAAALTWHGSIDGQAFVAIVSGTLGLGVGSGIHAAGVKSGGAGGGTP